MNRNPAPIAAAADREEVPRLSATILRYFMAKKSVAADPTQWSEKSQRSVAAAWSKEYRDIPYFCWRCGNAAVFSAEDQKRSFELKKNHIDQRRILCDGCWTEANTIRKSLAACEQQWASHKATLRKDVAFLAGWLESLTNLERSVPYRPDIAKKNMLKKLIGNNA